MAKPSEGRTESCRNYLSESKGDRKMKKKLVMMFVCGLLVLTSSWCFADTILFTDLTGGPYAQIPGYTIDLGSALGFEFATSATATLDSIEIALSEFAPDPVTATSIRTALDPLEQHWNSGPT